MLFGTLRALYALQRLTAEIIGMRADVRSILQGTQHMTDTLDTIIADVADLKTAITASNAEIDTLVAQLKVTPPEDPRAQQIADQITGLTSAVNAKLASVTPAPAPAPVAAAAAAAASDPAAATTDATPAVPSTSL